MLNACIFFCSTAELPQRHYSWYQNWGWAMPLWYKGNKPTAYPSHPGTRPSLVSRPSMDIRRESWLSQQMGDLRRISRFSPMASEQLAELRRASYVSQQMAYEQYHQQKAYQHAAAGQMRRGSLQDYHPRAYSQPGVTTSPYHNLMSPQQQIPPYGT